MSSRGIKAASLSFGILLCMALIQTAIAQPDDDLIIEDASIKEIVAIENTTNIIDPQTSYTILTAGSSTQFTVSFINKGSEALVLTPEVIAVPNSQNKIDESWIKITPTDSTVEPGSTQKFDIEINIPREAEGGYYKANIAFTDDLVPDSAQYVNSMNLEVTVQALPNIQLETQYISDTIDAGKDYEYKISMKNVADKDITINPEIPENSNYFEPSYTPAFSSEAIEISAPSTIKAGESANMIIKVKVPQNVSGKYNGNINLNVNGEAATEYTTNSQITLDLNVFKQPSIPYIKTFNTLNEKPVTIEVSADTYECPWLVSPEKEKPSFELTLKSNSNPVTMNFVKSIESGSVSIGGGYYPLISPLDDKTIYQSYGSRYVETYTAPGAVGNWELSMLPKNTQSFGYSITVRDSEYNKSKN